MAGDFYRFGLPDRRRLLADAGFVRDDLRIWLHPDGRAIGESVAAALTDQAFFRFLKTDMPEIMDGDTETSDESGVTP